METRARPAAAAGMSLHRAARRPRREQAMAAGAARPGLQDHLARLGRSAPRDGGEVAGGERRRAAAQVAARRTAGARVDHAGCPTRRARHPDRAGPQGLRPLRQGPLVQRIRAAERRPHRVRRACLRGERRRDEDRRSPPPGDARRGCARAGARRDRGPAARAGAAAQAWGASVPRAADAALRRSGAHGVGGGAARQGRAGGLRASASALGHGDRPGQVHRLLGLCHRVLRREQSRDGGRRAGGAPAADELAADRALLHGRGGRPSGGRGGYADAVPAVRQRPVRAGVPGVRGLSHGRRLERPGLQPVRGDAVLRQQLPVQGPLLQLVQLRRARRRMGELARSAQHAAQPGRHGARKGRDGKVHLLRATHPRRAEPGPVGRPQRPGRGHHAVVRPGVPFGGDRVRRPAGPRLARRGAGA